MIRQGLPLPIPRVPAWAQMPEVATANRDGLACIFTEVQFPAQWWQIVTAAEAYCVDAGTQCALRGLAKATYRSIESVVEEVSTMTVAVAADHRPDPNARVGADSGPRQSLQVFKNTPPGDMPA